MAAVGQKSRGELLSSLMTAAWLLVPDLRVKEASNGGVERDWAGSVGCTASTVYRFHVLQLSRLGSLPHQVGMELAAPRQPKWCLVQLMTVVISQQ